ncbi:MAG TPA: alpha/beta fold hydrolase [Chitinophagaceae bacterium]|nr:alpha/beta fold hydrolase [Chitinophagaceae bacterium]
MDKKLSNNSIKKLKGLELLFLNRFIFCLLITINFLFSSYFSFAQKQYNFTSLQHKIQTWIDSGYYNGASIIIVKNNKTVFENYFGNYKPNTVAFIASSGKWLAAATIAAVVDEGKLNWNDKVKKWLPEFTDAKGDATLAQLLSHTAGYPDYQPNNKPADIYQTLKESVAHIVSLPADTLPGTKFKYGGLAMNVAGRMAEIATGKDWETLFIEKIAAPLNMRLTHFTPVDSSGGHAPMLGGGARTSLHDYINFLSMIYNDGIFNGRKILSDNAIKIMRADHVLNANVNENEFVQNARGSLRKDIYGLGEWREEVDANNNATLISSPSWAGAYSWIDKKNGVYGFFMTHIVKTKNGFNSFLASPVIPLYVRDAIDEANHPEVKRGFVNVANGKLYYEELGKGEPLIFIHGHSFDHTEWKPQLYEFAKKYRVIVYDVRGYGRSTMPQEFSAAMHADDLKMLMDDLKIKKAHVVGLSMGGFIGLDFLVLHQNKLLSVTLADGDIWNGSPGPEIPWNDSAIKVRREEIQQLYKKGIDVLKRKWFNALTIRNGKVINQIREPVWNMIYKWDAWQPTHIEPRFLLGTSVTEKLKQTKITVPVLVLRGEYDADKNNAVLKLIPLAKQAVVPYAGHVSNLENTEGFNYALHTFLKSIHSIQLNNNENSNQIIVF